MFILGSNSLRKNWSLGSTVWENIDPWFEQSEKILILGFNSLMKFWSLDSTVWENINTWFQQSEKIVILGFNSLRKKLVLAFTNLRKCLRKNWNLVLTVWENIFLVSNSLRKYWSLSSQFEKILALSFANLKNVWEILQLSFNSLKIFSLVPTVWKNISRCL